MSSSSNRTKLSYIAATDDDRAAMIEAIGAASIDELFEQIPAEARLNHDLNLPLGLAEQDVVALCAGLADRNSHLGQLTCFLGAGAYDHYVPAVVDTVLSRSEFNTAYTPYQPEASQGILQSIFEYQSMISALTGMDVSNASLYDAATAVGEAAIMAHGINGGKRVLVSKAVHPHYRQVLSTYVSGFDIEVEEIDLEDLRERLDESTSCVIVQYPNFFGTIEPLADIAATLGRHFDSAQGGGPEGRHGDRPLLIVCVDPIALGMLTPPGEYGADIVVGEGQPLGINIGFGGPFLGLFACKQEHVWHVPGRLVGQSVDADGRRAFTLTLQTREQHIRREKATSNICTNQALVALAATVYLSALGKNGLRHVSELCFHKAHYAMERILSKPGYSLPWDAPFFKEFVVKTEKPVAEINRHLLENGILGGLDLGSYYPELQNCMLICVTEKRTKQDIDRFVELLP